MNGSIAGDGGVVRVAVNSFPAAGRDEFTTLPQGTNKAETEKMDVRIMYDYFPAFPVATPACAQRSVADTLSPFAGRLSTLTTVVNWYR